MYELIGQKASRALRVLITLEELGVPYTHKAVPPHSPEALAVNASGKIPALRDGDLLVTDSLAIMTYLADKHGALTHPAGTPERARQDVLTFRILDELEGPLWGEGKQRYFAPKNLRAPVISDFLRWDYGRSIVRFEDLMTGAFLMGDRLLLPDILLGQCLRWAQLFDFPAPGPELAAYYDRIAARPAFQAALNAA